MLPYEVEDKGLHRGNRNSPKPYLDDEIRSLKHLSYFKFVKLLIVLTNASINKNL